PKSWGRSPKIVALQPKRRVAATVKAWCCDANLWRYGLGLMASQHHYLALQHYGSASLGATVLVSVIEYQKCKIGY
ncbi:hypothetical protein PanWU01x14_371320, partial [Parasponia andersonii]